MKSPLAPSANIADVIEIRQARPMVSSLKIAEIFERPIHKHAGYIYVVEFHPKHIKIGMSQNPKSRISALANQSGIFPSRAWLSPACYNFKELEQEMHSIFSANRLIGEYFEIEFDDARMVARDLNFNFQNDEQDAEFDADFSGINERVGKFVEDILIAGKAYSVQDVITKQNTRLSIRDIAECFGVSIEDVIATIGMCYEDFLFFGPIKDSTGKLMLNNVHISYLAILMPTTDKILPFKLLAAQRLALTYHDEDMGVNSGYS